MKKMISPVPSSKGISAMCGAFEIKLICGLGKTQANTLIPQSQSSIDFTQTCPRMCHKLMCRSLVPWKITCVHKYGPFYPRS